MNKSTDPHTRSPTRKRPLKQVAAGWAFAHDLILATVQLWPDPTYMQRVRSYLTRRGIRAAVANHDTPALFDWLFDVANYQGISDAIAWGYLEKHGRVRWADVSAAIEAQPSCPKLAGFASFKRCNYEKTDWVCAEPRHLVRCPVPDHPLRKGGLNQTAYSLYFFLRDECGDDLVGWLDRQLAAADVSGATDRAQRMRASLLKPLGAVYGFQSKIISMAFADLLMGTDKTRERWLTTGTSMIVIDTLVHNWMHRTGILNALGADHPYGVRCYRPGGCAEIIERVSGMIDARQFNPTFPASFPRHVQKAIWWLCSQSGLNVCNGNQIDDTRRCGNRACSLHGRCRRIILRPKPD